MVQSGIHDEFVDALRDSIERLKQGGPFEEGVNVGPLINGSAVDKVRTTPLMILIGPAKIYIYLYLKC